jgi:D-galactarolactone cycloisomerase
LKITAVEPIVLRADRVDTSRADGTQDAFLVRVHTNLGVVGIGEADTSPYLARTMIEMPSSHLIARGLREVLVGEDPLAIDRLWHLMYRASYHYGRAGVALHVISAIDMALWDIAGKVAGEPLYRMLGGQATERMPVYASLLRYGTAELVARNAGEALERGYRHIKLHEITVPEVEAARRAIGPAIPLMIDTNCPWTPDEAVAMAKRMAPFDPLWIEEPVWPPEDYRGLAKVRAEGGVAIAAGECAGTLADFTQLIDVAQVDYLQPSVTKMGGISEMRKVVALARSRGIKVQPHSPYFGPGLVASVHVCAALPDRPPVERFYCDLEASPFGDLVDAAGGHMRLPDGPGLGLVVDEAVIARYRVN